MVVDDVKVVHEVIGNIQNLVIKDRNASLTEINQLLERLINVENLTLEAPISSLPHYLNELQVKSLSIISSQANFKIEESLLPKSLDSIRIEVLTLDIIPDDLWSCNRIHIRAKKLLSQAYGEVFGDKDKNIFLYIDNLRSFPAIQASSVVVKSKGVLNIPAEFYSVNSESLHNLTIECDYLNLSNSDGLKLNVLQWCSICVKSDISGSELIFLPDSVSRLSVSSSQIVDFNLTDFSQLSYLSLDGLYTDTLSINSKALGNLSISNSSISNFGGIIAPNLSVLKIYNSVKEIPSFVFSCTRLVQLIFVNNEIDELPLDWSSLVNLENLSLNDNGIFFNDLTFLNGLDKLKSVSIFNNIFRDKYVFLTKKCYPISDYGMDRVLGCDSVRVNEVLKFGAAVEKAKLSEEHKRLFFNAFIASKDLLPFLQSSNDNLIGGFKINYRPLKLVLNSVVNDLVSNQSGINTIDGAQVFIDGKTKLSIADIKSILTVNNAIVHRVWCDAVTHVLFGAKPNDVHSFGEGLLYITENELAVLNDSKKFINVQVESGRTEIVDKVKSLLLSPDSANVMIGMKMLETGGVNENITSSLLAIAKAHTDAKTRSKAKKLLELYGPKEWAPLLSNKLLFKNLNGKVREQEINIKLAKISAEIGIDLACELSLSLYERFQKGLRFMVSRSKYPKSYAQRMFDMICNDGHLSLDVAMGFKNWKGKDASEIIFNKTKMKFPIPVIALEFKTIESIGLHNTKLTKIPRELAKFKDVKAVDLSCNNITKLPVFLSKMDSIEELDLSFNIFEEFPASLIELKNLKKVNLQYNRQNDFMGDFKPLEIPDEVKLRMPNCVFVI